METSNELLTSQSTGEGENAPQPPAPVVPQLAGKRANWTIAHKIEGESIMFSVKGAGNLILNTREVSEANRNRAMLHGMVQRISDAAAMARDSKTGASATPQEKFEAMRRLVEHYQSGSGEWSPARSVEGVGRPKSENANARLLRMALSLFNPAKDESVIAQFVKGLSAAQITALVVSEQLKDSVELAREQLSKEDAKLSEGVNAEELLSGL